MLTSGTWSSTGYNTINNGYLLTSSTNNVAVHHQPLNNFATYTSAANLSSILN